MLNNRIISLVLITSGMSLAQTTWFTGDVHSHLACTRGDVTTPENLFDDAKNSGVNVTHLLIHGWKMHWADRFIGQQVDPMSESENILQWGIEISGLPGAFNGHMDLINVSQLDAITTEEVNYPGREYMLPNYPYVQNTGGVIGFDHAQFWPVGYLGGGGNAPNSLPFDIVFEDVDFLSTNDDVLNEGFLFLWYAMLDAGFHLTPAAGSDYPCYVNDFGRVVTVIPIERSEFNMDSWLDGLKEGRTVIRDNNGDPDFLDMSVNGASLGAEILLPPGAATVTVEVQASSTENGSRVELLVNGEVVESEPIDDNAGTFTWEVPLTQSSWIAAKTDNAHTAATFVLLDGCPIRNDAEAAWNWVGYMDVYFLKFQDEFGASTSIVSDKVEEAKLEWTRIAEESEGTADPVCKDVTGLSEDLLSPSLQGNRFTIHKSGRGGGRNLVVAHPLNFPELKILNLQGKVVRTLLPEKAGEPLTGQASRFSWDGRDESGGIVPHGLYFALGQYSGRQISSIFEF